MLHIQFIIKILQNLSTLNKNRERIKLCLTQQQVITPVTNHYIDNYSSNRVLKI